MSTSPEFFKPAAPALSPAACATQALAAAGRDDNDYCTTPTGSRISYHVPAGAQEAAAAPAVLQEAPLPAPALASGGSALLAVNNVRIING